MDHIPKRLNTTPPNDRRERDLGLIEAIQIVQSKASLAVGGADYAQRLYWLDMWPGYVLSKKIYTRFGLASIYRSRAEVD